MVDIGGRKLHFHCTGTGLPTVVLMAGGGGYAIDWALVQPRVAESTRVCSYDRAGLGWSDPGPAYETVEQTVADLRKGLQAAGERGPYILVGASIGGIFIRAYQNRFPDDVAALVFTNSSNRVGVIPPGGGGGLLWEVNEDVVRSAFPPPPATPTPRPIAIGDPFDRLPADLHPIHIWLDVRGGKVGTQPRRVLKRRCRGDESFSESSKKSTKTSALSGCCPSLWSQATHEPANRIAPAVPARGHSSISLAAIPYTSRRVAAGTKSTYFSPIA